MNPAICFALLLCLTATVIQAQEIYTPEETAALKQVIYT